MTRRNEKADLEALRNQISAHILLNNAQLDGFPLLLSVVGAPGIGKTHNIRLIAKECGARLFEVSSSALAHHHEGMVLYPLIRAYRDAAIIGESQPALLMVDDFDRSIASNYKTAVHTIHSQLLVGFFMDLCDNPYSIPDEGKREMCETRRVPIVFTANTLSGLDEALIRPQRMRILDFDPSSDDKLLMMRSAFSTGSANSEPMDRRDLERLLNTFRDKSIAFFSDIVAAHLVDETSLATRTGKLPSDPNDLKFFLQTAMQKLDYRRAVEIGQKLSRS